MTDGSPFERLPTTPTSEELLDKAFSRAARARRAKQGREAQESMLQTASNILSDNLENVVTAWPDFDAVDPFYRDLAAATLADRLGEEGEGDGVDALRGHLAELSWAASKTHDLGRDYMGRLRGHDADAARKLREQAFARMASVMEEIEDDLAAVGAARDLLRELPDLRPDEPAIVVAGYPNVGKTTFVNRVTDAHNETAAYPFTTRAVAVGHVEHRHVRYQLVDTPGLLDRPAAERNQIESQAVSALVHLADAVLFFLDASEACGYPLADQRALLAEVEERFDAPVLVVCSKADRFRDVAADHYLSVAEDENVEATLQAAIDAVGYEPELPFEE